MVCAFVDLLEKSKLIFLEIYKIYIWIQTATAVIDGLKIKT